VPITVVFETHAISEDNELGVASGWSHSRLSDRGRRQARELGERRRDEDRGRVQLRPSPGCRDRRHRLRLRARRSCSTGACVSATTASGTAIRPKRTAAIELRTSTSRSRAGRAGGRRSPASAASSTTSHLSGTELESSLSATSRRGGTSITTSSVSRSRTWSTRCSSGGPDASTASTEPATRDAAAACRAVAARTVPQSPATTQRARLGCTHRG
jgi:Histidine phosphatase superfamily (branch 1)